MGLRIKQSKLRRVQSFATIVTAAFVLIAQPAYSLVSSQFAGALSTEDGTSLAITSPSDGQAVSGTVPIKVSTGVPTSYTYIEINKNGVWKAAATINGDNPVWSFDTTKLPDGSYTIKVDSASKAAGTREVKRNFTIDNTRPVVAVVSPLASVKPMRGTVTVKGTASDNLTGLQDDQVEVQLRAVKPDNGKCGAFVGNPVFATVANDKTWSASYDTRGLDDGNYCINVIAHDGAGNENGNGGTQVKYVVLDNTPPVVTDITPAAGVLMNGLVTFNITAEAGNNPGYSYLEWNKNGVWKTDNTKASADPTIPNSSSPTHPRLTINTNDYAEGTYTLKVDIVDAIGNTTEKNIPYVVDHTAPVVSVPADSGAVNGDTLQLMGTAKDDNMDEYRYQILDSNQENTLGSIGWSRHGGNTSVDNGLLANVDVSGLSDGTYYIRVWATDKAGNRTGTKQVPYLTKFVIDRQAPTVLVTTSGNQTTATPTIEGTVSGDAAALKISIDGVDQTSGLTYNPGDTTWSFVPATPLSDGQHTIVATALDAANNTASSTSTITVDTTVPQSSSGSGGIDVTTDTTPTPDPLLQQLSNKLTQPFTVPSNFGSLIIPTQAATTPATSDQSVLGAQTKKDDANTPASDVAAIAPTTSGWKFFGLAWYWWLAIIAAVLGITWQVITRVRRRGDAQLA